MKKITVLLLILALLLGGCGTEPAATEAIPATAGSQATQPKATEDPEKFNVTLELWVTEEDIWSDDTQVRQVLENFRAYYPNISVNVTHVTREALEGELPDLLLADTKTLSDLAAAGKLADLTQLWEGIDDTYQHVDEMCGMGGSKYALPLCLVADCMAIRLPEFENAQCMNLISTANHTWSSTGFLQAVENLTLAGVENPISIYCKDTSGDACTRLLVENFGGGHYVRMQDGVCQIDTPPMSQALKTLSGTPGLALRGDLDAAGAREEFLAGNSAMVLNWTSALQLKHGAEGEILYMLYPGNGRARTYAEVYGLAVCSGEDVRQSAASMTLAAFLRDSAEAVLATGQLPARKSGMDAYEGTVLESRMEDLSKLLLYIDRGEAPGQNWEKARSEWALLLRRIAGGEDVALAIEACRAALAP